MTLQINSANTISGIPITKVRDFFRHLVSWHQHSFELTRMQEHLLLDAESALALATELQTQGYLKGPKKGVYTFTAKGEDLIRASAAGQVRRQTAEKALVGLLARVEQYNSDPNKLLIVEAIVVFGSFLGANDKLGDLDIAIKHRRRNPDDHEPARNALAYAQCSGHHFSNLVERISWPETELYQLLRARKRTIAIQDWHTFLRMTESAPDHFQYKIVFGSKEDVSSEIHARSKKNK